MSAGRFDELVHAPTRRPSSPCWRPRSGPTSSSSATVRACPTRPCPSSWPPWRRPATSRSARGSSASGRAPRRDWLAPGGPPSSCTWRRCRRWWSGPAPPSCPA